jgi:hypothetical protein
MPVTHDKDINSPQGDPHGELLILYQHHDRGVAL